MKKLKLDPNALRVESFAALPNGGAQPGTVHGRDSYLTQFGCETEGCPPPVSGCGCNAECTVPCDVYTRGCSSSEAVE